MAPKFVAKPPETLGGHAVAPPELHVAELSCVRLPPNSLPARVARPRFRPIDDEVRLQERFQTCPVCSKRRTDAAPLVNAQHAATIRIIWCLARASRSAGCYHPGPRVPTYMNWETETSTSRQAGYETPGIPGGDYRELPVTVDPVLARYRPGTPRYLGLRVSWGWQAGGPGPGHVWSLPSGMFSVRAEGNGCQCVRQARGPAGCT